MMPADASPAGTPPRLRLLGVSKTYRIWQPPQGSAPQRLARTLARAWSLLGLPGRERLQARYAETFTALQGIDLTVQPGECVGILGENGSGKSTLLQIVAGIFPATTGTVEVRGRIGALLELGSGFDDEFTGRENVYLNASIIGVPEAEVTARWEELAAFADIGGFIDQPVRTYSSGMRIRLAFAVQILIRPELLIVDEALAVGDAAFQRKCFGRLAELREQGTTILFVSHDASAVLNLCDRAMMLYRGEMISAGHPKQVVADYERFSHASPAHRPGIIAALRQGRSPVEHLPKPRAEADARASIEDPGQAYFDPDLPQAQPVIYRSQGATIQQPQVTTLEGQPVNLVRRGETYCFTYQVAFEQPAERVNFAMLIKTTQGVELGGARSFPNRATLAQIAAGTVYEVRFQFTCHLNHGWYFLNAGVEGYVEGEPTYLHRVIDAYLIHVAAEPDPQMTCTVDFGIRADCQPVATPTSPGAES